AAVPWAAPAAQKRVGAVVQVPGSKSLAGRWMLLAAIADEPARLRGALVSRDTRLVADGLERLGATLRFEDAELQVTPLPLPSQSEERRVGKECRSRRSPAQTKRREKRRKTR